MVLTQYLKGRVVGRRLGGFPQLRPAGSPGKFKPDLPNAPKQEIHYKTKKPRIHSKKCPNLKTWLLAGFGICGCFNSTFLQ